MELITVLCLVRICSPCSYSHVERAVPSLKPSVARVAVVNASSISSSRGYRRSCITWTNAQQSIVYVTRSSDVLKSIPPLKQDSVEATTDSRGQLTHFIDGELFCVTVIICLFILARFVSLRSLFIHHVVHVKVESTSKMYNAVFWCCRACYE